MCWPCRFCRVTDPEEDLDSLARGARDAGAQWLAGSVLFLMPASLKQFMPFLDKKFPKLSKQYREWYGRFRNVPEAYRQEIAARVEKVRRKYELGARTRTDESRAWKSPQMQLVWQGEGRNEPDEFQRADPSSKIGTSHQELQVPILSIETKRVRGVKLKHVSAFAMLLSVLCLCAFLIGRVDAAPPAPRDTGQELDVGNLRGPQLLKCTNVLQDHLDHVFVAKFRVNHRVIERAARPFRTEVVANEGGTLGIHFGDQLGSFLLGLSECSNPANFFLSRRVDEHVESVRMVAQNVRRAAPHDNAVSSRGDVLHYLVQHRYHLVRVKARSRTLQRKRSLVAASRKNPKQPVNQRVHAFVAQPRSFMVDLRDARDFRGEFFVPQFPA